ncbi:TonB-dependent receptor plug domain-containing protein [Mucilaginibacter gynuensis]|uniref:TonB-dependent receptor plug domain-containing protein n=1 Tax=Mucilaginibacter gynuensis TaxID=1302236 RepID=A0ABP8FMN3_9SPHI
MRALRPLLFALIFSALPFCTLLAQDTVSLTNIIAKTGKYYNDYPVEKVYLHFDKPYYAVSDTVWFKAYVTIDENQFSGLSKIVHIEVLNQDDKLMQAVNLPLKNGVASGNVVLSTDFYKKGNYRFVAHTNYMNNSDAGYFFNKIVAVGNAIDNQVSTNINLKSTVVNKVAKIDAGIYFKDDQGNPLSNRKVNWMVDSDPDVLAKGKGTTDANGMLQINFTNTKNIPLDTTHIATTIEMADRKEVRHVFPLKTVAKSPVIQFFPEGGDLISGLNIRVAFKALRADGLGIDAKGTIVDNTGKVVANFNTTHAGMGFFELNAEEDKTYKANVTFSDGNAAEVDLPTALRSGISLVVDNNDPNLLLFKIQSSPAYLERNKNKIFYVVGQTRGIINYGAQTRLENPVYNARVAKTKFPAGVLQLTLMSSTGRPLSERLVYINHPDSLKLSLKTDKPTYTKRQKVHLTVAANEGGKPVDGEFSLTVVDESKVPYTEDKEITIQTYLLLTSDIAGYIEKPNYYFNATDDKKTKDLDVLMMTQGYRRFEYRGLLRDNKPTINFYPEQGLDITGILRSGTGIPVNKGNVRLLIPDKSYSANAITDAEGRFRFANLNFSDSTKVILSARNNYQSANMVLSVDGQFGIRIPINIYAADEMTNIDSTITPYLKNSKVQYSNSHTLKEVTITQKKIVKVISHRDYPGLSGLSEADHMIRGDQLSACQNLYDCLRGMVVGMTFDQDKFYVSRSYNQGQRVPAQVFLRGMPIDVNDLRGIDPKDVESIEVFVKDDLGTVNRAYQSNGAIVINTKEKPKGQKISLAQLQEMLPKTNEITFMPQGFGIQRTFYSPQYLVAKTLQNTGFDARSTIFWKPDVTINKTGVAAFDFFNADSKGTYRVIVEGLSNGGNIGRKVYRFKVE